MNHWIYLAQAATGHPNGRRYRVALDKLREAADRIVIPLACVHYMEMEGNRNSAQRADVANIMEELSGPLVSPRSSILRLEVDDALARLGGLLSRFDDAALLGWGVLQAFGRRGGLSVHSGHGDVTAKRGRLARRVWLRSMHGRAMQTSS